MRIQQTDRILKESRLARHSHEARAGGSHDANVLSRTWKAMTALPARLFRRNHE